MTDSSTASERVGRYQLLEPIGGGPNGAVSRAKLYGVAGFERQFAVKRFAAELTMIATHAQAVSAAARAYGSLEHPRIARMSEFGVAQGQTFTAVELVVGLDAMRLMAEAKLSGTGLAIGGALGLVSQAARAVGYAHGRGLCHLGLSPTNVIVTADGDIKVTDFGILAATLTASPVDLPRLAQRIAYLAPEQLAGEAVSAATDVFALGVLAYELVSGQPAYRGQTPRDIANAILSGPPIEPSLPRPIVRVLQRCVARSPFERFPDARAFADAIDAALRVAPVPGTRKDIGAQVKATLDHHATMNEGNLSGMVALNLGTGPVRGEPAPPPRAMGALGSSGRAAEPVASALPAAGKASMTTVPGLAPPPIPVPPGVSPPPIAPRPAFRPVNTVPGLLASRKPGTPLAVPDAIDPVPRRPGPIIPPVRTIAEEPPPQARVATTLSDRAPTDAAEIDAVTTRHVPDADAALDESPFEQGLLTNAMSPLLTDQLNRAAKRPTGEIAAAAERVIANDPLVGFPDEAHGSATAAPGEPSPTSTTVDLPPPPRTAGQSSAEPEPSAPRPAVRPSAPARPAMPGSRSRLPAILIAAVLVSAFGGGGWFVWKIITGGTTETSSDQVVAIGSARPARSGGGPPATGSPEPRGTDHRSAQAIDAAVHRDVAAISIDAAVAIDATTAAVPTGHTAPQAVVAAPTGSSDSLELASTPAGARVFIDGADQGVTPVKLPGSADHHNLALLLAGHELYVAQVAGHGTFTIPLKPVTPSGGPAGIKVIKCKAKDRYYVSIDGKPSGMTCPTERIECGLGLHTVEVYDLVTESRRSWDIKVSDTRLSYRVRVD